MADANNPALLAMPNPALLVGQPIGYVAPAPGAKLALGIASQLDAVAAPQSAPLTDPRLCNNLGAPLTRRQDEGFVTRGHGQAATAASSARLTGLNAT